MKNLVVEKSLYLAKNSVALGLSDMLPIIRQVDVIQVQLVTADPAQQTVDGAIFQPDPHLVVDFPQNRFLILFIKDDELTRILKTMDVFPENTDAEAMVGRNQTGVIPPCPNNVTIRFLISPNVLLVNMTQRILAGSMPRYSTMYA